VYVVTFFTEIHESAAEEYEAWSRKMQDLARSQPGFLGFEAVRQKDGKGISVSFWKTLKDIESWKNHPEHVKVQKIGREKFYKSLKIIVSKTP
jgi:heme-degrading monooxygenase HmoA